MIKYKNKLIFSVFCLIFLVLPYKVLAKGDATLMYVDCAYNISYGANNIKSGNESAYTKDLHIAYSDVLDSGGSTFKVKVTDASGSFYENVNENFNAKFSASIRETDQTRSTFTSAYAGNGNSCPKYMTLEQYSGDKYTVLFSNELSDRCSGTPGTQCKMIYNYSSNNYKVYMSPTEDIWSYSVGANNASICDHLNLDLTISKGKKLQVLATYGKESTYEKYTNWTSPKEVTAVWFEDIANLARNKQVGIVTIDPQTDNFAGTTGVHFTSQDNYNWNYAITMDTACEVKNPTFSTKKTCKTYNDVSADIIAKQDAALASAKGIDDVAEKYLTFNRSSDTYSSKSYSTVKDAKTLYNTATEINKAVKDSTFSASSTSYIDYLNGLTSDKTLCADAVDQIGSILSSYSDLAAKKTAEVNVLIDTLNKIKDRLTALGEKDKAAAVAGYIDTAKGVATEIASVSAKARTSYLSSQKFGIKKFDSNNPCGIISTDLKNFLQTIIDYIRIAGIAIAVILGILDYIKVIFGSDEKSMAKANKNFSTRLIAVALLFLIPAILTFILGLFNILGTGNAGTCGIN